MSPYALHYFVPGIEYKEIMEVSTTIELSEIQDYKVNSCI